MKMYTLNGTHFVHIKSSYICTHSESMKYKEGTVYELSTSERWQLRTLEHKEFTEKNKVCETLLGLLVVQAEPHNAFGTF